MGLNFAWPWQLVVALCVAEVIWLWVSTRYLTDPVVGLSVAYLVGLGALPLAFGGVAYYLFGVSSVVCFVVGAIAFAVNGTELMVKAIRLDQSSNEKLLALLESIEEPPQTE